MTRDELVKLVGGYIAGGNVVKDNVCYGRLTEGVFVLTEEGKQAVAAANEAPKAALRAKAKPKADPAPEVPLDDLE